MYSFTLPPLPRPLPHPVGEEESNEPPKSLWKPPPVVPKEDNKTGANKKTYFVCNERTSYTSYYKCVSVCVDRYQEGVSFSLRHHHPYSLQ